MSALTLRHSHSGKRTLATHERWSLMTAALTWSAVSAGLWGLVIGVGRVLF